MLIRCQSVVLTARVLQQVQSSPVEERKNTTTGPFVPCWGKLVRRKNKTWPKRAFWPPKKAIFALTNKDRKGQNCFSLKLTILQLLAKFKQKIMWKSKNMAKKNVFFSQKGSFLSPPKLTKRAKIAFSLKLHFLHF